MAAILEITEKLKETGMSQIEIDYLLARFLEEEAQSYIDYMEDMNELVAQKESTMVH